MACSTFLYGIVKKQFVGLKILASAQDMGRLLDHEPLKLSQRLEESPALEI